VHFSGVIATVAAGVLCGNHGRVHVMSTATQQAVNSFWLALGLPEDLEHRAQIVTLTAGVVILSLVGQG
jgi:NhaP-type Na+/H+ or K+/H+ antiporter